MLILWDGLRKPIKETIKNQTTVVDDFEVTIATFDTEPFRDVEEFEQYQRALQSMPHKPITASDFDELFRRVEEKEVS